MFYNFNTFNEYMSNVYNILVPRNLSPYTYEEKQYKNDIIFSLEWDSSPINLTEYYDNIEISGSYTFDYFTQKYIGTPNLTTRIYNNTSATDKLYINSKFQSLSFMYQIDNITTDFTIPLHEFNFKRLSIQLGSFGNCLIYSSVHDTNNSVANNDFQQASRFIINESLVFSLVADVIGSRECLEYKPKFVGDTRGTDGSQESHAIGSIMHYHKENLNNDEPTNYSNTSQNVYDSLLLADTTVYDRPCDVTQDILGIEQSKSDTIFPHMILDGSFTRFQKTYFNQYNENVNVTLHHEQHPDLIFLPSGNMNFDNNYTDNEMDIRYIRGSYNRIILTNYQSNKLRYYTNDSYLLMEHGWQNTIFGNFKVGNNLADANQITTSPHSEQEAGKNEDFVNGTIIQFSPTVDVIKSAIKYVPHIDPMEPEIDGEGQNNTMSDTINEISSEILTPSTVVNTQDEFILSVHTVKFVYLGAQYQGTKTGKFGPIGINPYAFNDFPILHIGYIQSNKHVILILSPKNNGEYEDDENSISEITIDGGGGDQDITTMTVGDPATYEGFFAGVDPYDGALTSQEFISSSSMYAKQYTITIKSLNPNFIN